MTNKPATVNQQHHTTTTASQLQQHKDHVSCVWSDRVGLAQVDVRLNFRISNFPISKIFIVKRFKLMSD